MTGRATAGFSLFSMNAYLIFDPDNHHIRSTINEDYHHCIMNFIDRITENGYKLELNINTTDPELTWHSLKYLGYTCKKCFIEQRFEDGFGWPEIYPLGKQLNIFDSSDKFLLDAISTTRGISAT